MFLFKKLVSSLFFPVPLCLEILVIGVVLLWFTRKQQAGKIIVSIGVLFLLLLSNPTISTLLLRTLERQYPPLALTSSGPVRSVLPTAKFIVVLGASYSLDPQLPVTSQLGEEAMVRLVEAIRLHRRLPGSRLVLSGGAWPYPVAEAEIMARVAEALGVSPNDVVLESQSRDTEDQAQLIRPLVGKDPFILVTSAAHMPRSMALFNKLGMDPVAAPTDHLVKQNEHTGPEDVYPSDDALREARAAVHEYLGLAWEKLRGKI